MSFFAASPRPRFIGGVPMAYPHRSPWHYETTTRDLLPDAKHHKCFDAAKAMTSRQRLVALETRFDVQH